MLIQVRMEMNQSRLLIGGKLYAAWLISDLIPKNPKSSNFGKFRHHIFECQKLTPKK